MGKEKKRQRSTETGAVNFEVVRKLALAMPETAEGTSYGTPAFRVGKSLYARLHQDGVSLVVRIDPDERAMRMRVDPTTFFITDHYRDYPWVLVRLATVDPEDLREVLEQAWRLSAPKRLLSTYTGEANDCPD